jgi:hypothetical protein
MRRWIVLLLALGLLLPPAYVLADRVKGAFQSLDATDNVTTARVVTGTLTVTGASTFTDNTINGADLIDNTVTSAKILDNSLASGKILDNTIALGKINSSGTKDNTTFLRGDGEWTKRFRGALATMDNCTKAVDNAVNTVLNNFCSEDYDTDSIHTTSGNAGRLTVPAGITRVRISGFVSFPADANGIREVYINKNGSSFAGRNITYIHTNSASQPTTIYLSTPIVTVVAGDYFDFTAYQDSGSTLTVSAITNWIAMEIIE